MDICGSMAKVIIIIKLCIKLKQMGLNNSNENNSKEGHLCCERTIAEVEVKNNKITNIIEKNNTS